jgi:hypothetical protein
MGQRFEELESMVDSLLNKGEQSTREQRQMVIALAKELRLRNNYTLTENLEKLGNSELPSFDLFRKEKAQTKRKRQRLIEKLHLLMGNDEEYRNDPFKDLRSFDPLVNVEVEDLGLGDLQVPVNRIHLAGQNGPMELGEMKTLIEKELTGTRDVASNPLALAMLGIGSKEEGKGLELMKMVGKASVGVLDQWANGEASVPELANLQVKDLKDVFFRFLQNRNVCVYDSVGKEEFIEMQLKEGIADVMNKEGFNEDDLVEYLGQRSHRGLSYETLLDTYEQLGENEMENARTFVRQSKYAKEDLEQLLDLAERRKFDVEPRVVRRVLTTFNILAKPYLAVSEKTFDPTNTEFLEIFNENKDLGEIPDLSEDERDLDKEYRHRDYVEDDSEKTIHYVIHEDDDDLKTTVNGDDLKIVLQDDEEKSEEEVEEVEPPKYTVPTHFDKVKLNQPFFIEMIHQGVLERVSIVDKEKIIEAMELQRLARETSSSRMKQYLLMYKIAETPRERQFCLQKLRKELLSFDKFDLNMLEEQKDYGYFPLFIDALAKRLENDIRSEDTNQSKMGDLIQQILKREHVTNLAKSEFKTFLADKLENSENEGIEVDMEVTDHTQSPNLQLSGKYLKKLAESSDTPSIQDFWAKLKIAYSGKWDRFGRDINIFNSKI